MDEDSSKGDEPLRTDHGLPASSEHKDTPEHHHDNPSHGPAEHSEDHADDHVEDSVKEHHEKKLEPLSDISPSPEPPAPSPSFTMPPPREATAPDHPSPSFGTGPTPAAAPQPAALPPQPSAVPPPQAPAPAQAPAHHDDAGTIILQWLTYAFWGWTVLILSVLTYTVFMDFLDQGDGSSFSYYIISAALVLLPISFVCDYLYSKKEPPKKTGAASIVMVVHAVLFALFGIGSLIWGVFSLVFLITSGGSDNSTTLAGLYSSLVIAIFYAATFARTLNPPRFPWIPKVYKLAMVVLVGIFILLGFLGVHHNAGKTISSSGSSSSSSYSTPNSSNSFKSQSTSNYPDKEELNKQGQRRPPQYLHICDTPDGSVEYVSQGNPNCLGNDVYQGDYDPSVAGTVYSSPCKTTSGKLRYVYISNDETCPPGTTLIFYNSLGGSTSGPAGTVTN